MADVDQISMCLVFPVRESGISGKSSQMVGRFYEGNIECFCNTCLEIDSVIIYFQSVCSQVCRMWPGHYPSRGEWRTEEFIGGSQCFEAFHSDVRLINKW